MLMVMNLRDQFTDKWTMAERLAKAHKASFWDEYYRRVAIRDERRREVDRTVKATNPIFNPWTDLT